MKTTINAAAASRSPSSKPAPFERVRKHRDRRRGCRRLVTLGSPAVRSVA